MSKYLTDDDKRYIGESLELWRNAARSLGYRVLFTHYYRDNKASFRVGEEYSVWLGYARQYCATSCVLISEFEAIARGFCVCDFTDAPYKPYGRLRSLRRAVLAVLDGPTMDRLSRNSAQHIDVPIYKSERLPVLTGIERCRLEKLRKAHGRHEEVMTGHEKIA